MSDSPVSRGRILSISSRGRITLLVEGRLVLGQLLEGGGWIGDPMEGDMRPGLRLWRNPRNGIVSRLQVLMAEVETDAPAQGDSAWRDARAA